MELSLCNASNQNCKTRESNITDKIHLPTDPTGIKVHEMHEIFVIDNVIPIGVFGTNLVSKLYYLYFNSKTN